MYLSTNSGLLLLIILIPAAILTAYVYYRKANLNKNQKVFLTTLRAVSLTALFVLLVNPVLHYFNSKKNIPVNVFLFDKSKSMKINGGDSAAEITENHIKNNFKTGENVFYNFANGLYPQDIPADSIDDNLTNLSAAFDELFRIFPAGDISSINIITDGNINCGGNPAFEAGKYNIPVNYLPAGDTSVRKDVMVSDVYYNKDNFIEAVSPVKAIIKSSGFNGREKIIFNEEGKEISSQVIDLHQDKSLYEVMFNAASEKPGFKRYTVKCEDIPGEVTNKNNYRDFYLKFTDNKFNVLVICGSPSADFALLKNELSGIQNFRVKYLTQKSPETFYEGGYDGLKDVQCLMFAGFPSVHTGDGLINKISDDIVRYKVPVFFIDGSGTDLDKIKKFEDILPFEISSGQFSEIQSGLRSVSNQVYKSLEPVNSFPPVYVKENCYSIKPGCGIYILSEKSQLPVLSVYKSGDIHSASFLAYNFYKWRLSRTVYDYGSFFNDMLTKTVSDIITPGNNKIRLTAERDILSVNTIEDFTVSVNNPENVHTEIKVYLQGANTMRDIYTTKTGGNLYKGTFRQPVKGEYTLTAELYENGIKTSQDERKILVDENNAEYLDIRCNTDIPEKMANLSGGHKYSPEEIPQLKSKLDSLQQIKKSEFKTGAEYPFRNSIVLFLIVILPVLLEWYFRKKIYKLR